MSIIKLAGNLSEMAEFDPLPDGAYPAALQDIEVRYSEKVPQGYLYCQLRIDPEDFPADYDAGNAPDGLVVNHSRTALPDAANRRTIRPFKAFLTAFGAAVDIDGFDPEELLNSQVQVILKRQEYQGSLVNNVESLSAIPTV